MGVSTRITRRSYSDYTIEEVFDIFKREKLAYGIFKIFECDLLRNMQQPLQLFTHSFIDGCMKMWTQMVNVMTVR